MRLGDPMFGRKLSDAEIEEIRSMLEGRTASMQWRRRFVS
jgi:hypothetical protein